MGSYNCLSPGRCQAIIWTNAELLLIGSLGTNFSEILIEIQILSFMKMNLIMSSGKQRPFCLGLNVLIVTSVVCIMKDELHEVWRRRPFGLIQFSRPIGLFLYVVWLNKGMGDGKQTSRFYDAMIVKLIFHSVSLTILRPTIINKRVWDVQFKCFILLWIEVSSLKLCLLCFSVSLSQVSVN